MHTRHTRLVHMRAQRAYSLGSHTVDVGPLCVGTTDWTLFGMSVLLVGANAWGMCVWCSVFVDSFADRRVRALRRVIQGRMPLGRPQLPAVLAENSSETCPTDKDGKRLLPDGSQWVVRD